MHSLLLKGLILIFIGSEILIFRVVAVKVLMHKSFTMSPGPTAFKDLTSEVARVEPLFIRLWSRDQRNVIMR